MTDVPTGSSAESPVDNRDEWTGSEPRWALTLYVAGASPHSVAAVQTVRRICDEELAGRVRLRVVDVADEPALVVHDHVYAVPTLVKRLPAPLRRLVGDLADADRVRAGLDLGLLPPRSDPGEAAP